MKKIFTLIIIGLISLEISAQNPDWVIYNTSNSDLPNNFISAVAEDNSGNLWIGSYNKISQQGNEGLAKFDGQNWTIYNTSNSYLLSNRVRAIDVDPEGNVWVGTDSGISVFNGNIWSNYAKEATGLFYNQIEGFAFQNNGDVWVATWRGICRFDGTNWEFWIADNSNIADDHIMDVMVNDNNEVFISTRTTGVYKFDGSDWTSMETGISGYWDFDKINQTIPLGTGLVTAGFHGAAYYDGASWTTYDSATTDFPDRSALSVALKDDNLWFTTKYGGVAQYDITNDTWDIYTTENSDLPANWSEEVIVTSLGNIVIGTENGLVILDYLTSVKDIVKQQQEQAFIYPNPTSDFCYINSNQEVEYVVLNTIGKVCKIGNDSKIDLRSLHKGIYFIKVKSDGVSTTYRVIKK
jgi:ligand-binding sensor domain-containing protein